MYGIVGGSNGNSGMVCFEVFDDSSGEHLWNVGRR